MSTSVVPEVEQLVEAVSPGTPVERLAAASDLADRLRTRADELLDEFVHAARSEGVSWSEIGGSLGTSKQAAQQRFAALAQPSSGEAPFGLTGAAGEVLIAAGNEAQQLGHHYIGPEHLVLGLLSQPDELAGRVLADLGVSLAAARERVAARLGTAAPRPTGSLGMTPQAKRLLEVARAMAKSLGHSCPRPEHFLLAAVSWKRRGPAATLIEECGVTRAQVQRELPQRLLSESPELARRMRTKSRLSRRRR